MEKPAVLSIIPGSATMKFNSALVFLFAGVNLLIYRKATARTKVASDILAGASVLIGLLTLAAYAGIEIISIDNLFVSDPFSETNPGRMSQATALCAILTGLGFWGYQHQNEIAGHIGLIGLKLMALLSLISVVAYLLLIPSEEITSFFQTMAIHTSVLFLALAVALLLRNPYSHFRRILLGRQAGSIIYRKLLPVVLLLPILFSFMLLLGIQKGIFTLQFGVVSYAVLIMTLSLIYVSFIALGLNRSDRERSRLEEDLKQRNAQLDQFKQGMDKTAIVAITDHKGVITYVNDLFCEVSGYAASELLGRTHALVNSGYHSKAFYQNLWDTIEKGDVWVDEIRNQSRDGQYYWVHTAIIPLSVAHGQQSEYLAIQHDITQRKEAEALLKSEYVKNLEFKNKELEQFVYIASHDLQEPLRTIIGFTELLGKDVASGTAENTPLYVEYITQAGQRMRALIKDLLDYGRIGRSKEKVLVDLEQLLSDIRKDMNQRIKENKAMVKVGQLPTLPVFETEIRQLFQNLISNALKFQHTETAPVVELQARELPGHWEFSVADNGIGIADQHKERIFTIFQRLHPKSEYEGTGIGLAHCRKIVELHGGDLWVESQTGKGSTFYFTLKK
ncbi:ATP-binding protein [Robiginitalea sp. M366]|uniref:sensor histidine kinase n=1 Tax=Robiginitalea aestuariiviva TaxID=3036903 RepID=UPI00240E971F|nr:ATP-binding protein [Robiginitalea aestuariiviva]MDG1572468.1 ATP-binding protein [Robiginitalea aestuariiviva]